MTVVSTTIVVDSLTITYDNVRKHYVIRDFKVNPENNAIIIPPDDVYKVIKALIKLTKKGAQP